MNRTRVKICGITRQEDASAAVAAGADAIGLVFYAGSKRAVTIEQAQSIVSKLPPLVTVVALFVDASAEEVAEVCAALPVSLLQFHGSEDADFCQSFALPWMKAIRVAGDTDIAAAAATYTGADALLLDTWRAGVPGGTGECFDWDQVPTGLPQPLVIAGGLNPANVAELVAITGPYAVDVSGGVEQSPGVKSAQLIDEFMDAVRAADRRSVVAK
ncbi:MAG: phosphoribosylanthranilate isomerase [Halieaceae bacterium]